MWCFSQQCYLPTMAEDMLPEARRVITGGGNFYGLKWCYWLTLTKTFAPLECPNGHPYFVGEVSQLINSLVFTTTYCHSVASQCSSQTASPVALLLVGSTMLEWPTTELPECSYLYPNIKESMVFLSQHRTDATQTGHSLGHPTTRGSVQSPERSLSPAACCILRAIMNSALVWVSCNNDTATEGLVELVKSGLQSPQELPEFFWGHLERDVQLLGQALGKNPEDAAIVVHLVLRNILTVSPPTAAVTLGALGTREVRSQWESQFSGLYINPILEVKYISGIRIIIVYEWYRE